MKKIPERVFTGFLPTWVRKNKDFERMLMVLEHPYYIYYLKEGDEFIFYKDPLIKPKIKASPDWVLEVITGYSKKLEKTRQYSFIVGKKDRTVIRQRGELLCLTDYESFIGAKFVHNLTKIPSYRKLIKSWKNTPQSLKFADYQSFFKIANAYDESLFEKHLKCIAKDKFGIEL